MQSIMADEICECKALFAEEDIDANLKQMDVSFELTHKKCKK